MCHLTIATQTYWKEHNWILKCESENSYNLFLTIAWFLVVFVLHIRNYFLIWKFSFGYCQDGYHTFRGGFWNYFSMGKNFKNVLKTFMQVSYYFYQSVWGRWSSFSLEERCGLENTNKQQKNVELFWNAKKIICESEHFYLFVASGLYSFHVADFF